MALVDTGMLLRKALGPPSSEGPSCGAEDFRLGLLKFHGHDPNGDEVTLHVE